MFTKIYFSTIQSLDNYLALVRRRIAEPSLTFDDLLLPDDDTRVQKEMAAWATRTHEVNIKIK